MAVVHPERFAAKIADPDFARMAFLRTSVPFARMPRARFVHAYTDTRRPAVDLRDVGSLSRRSCGIRLYGPKQLAHVLDDGLGAELGEVRARCLDCFVDDLLVELLEAPEECPSTLLVRLEVAGDVPEGPADLVAGDLGPLAREYLGSHILVRWANTNFAMSCQVGNP
jgi:hypothetical protein